ncbi:MAG: efflux RND transporter periplasmic adaptor subunit [Planctomycetaceae bacterium]
MRIRTILISIAAVAILCAGAWALYAGMHRRPAEESAAAESAPPANVVALTDTQIAAIGIQTGTAARRTMQSQRVTPGRLRYDNRRHVEVRASLTATISKIHVKPGDRVTAGQVLAVLSSPEVGSARSDVMVRKSELTLAQKQLDYQQTAYSGLEVLVAGINDNTKPEEILEKLKSSRVGSEGEKIISAYAKTLLSNQVAKRMESLRPSGVVSAQSLESAVTDRDSTRAVLTAAIQESLFSLRQSRERAAAAVADAERRLQVSREQVNSLLGYREDILPADPAMGLSFVEMRAPFAGTIEAQPFSVSERVAPRDSLFTLADTSTLWVAADIREAEWQALALKEGQMMTVRAPALPGRRLEAAVYYIGREVDPRTNSVPLVATIDNADGLLRPGQFVRIEVPLGPARDALAVPAAAVVEHDGQPFVFSPEPGDHFRRVNVQTGETIDDWTEITSGLKEGAAIVTHGAFALKSELLLVGEEE